MCSKELLSEICKEKEVIKHCFYSSFKNKQDELEYSLFKNDLFRKIRLMLGIVLNIFISAQIILFLVSDRYWYKQELIIEVFVLVFNTVSMFIIHLTPIYSKINIVFSYIKFFLNLLNYNSILIHNIIKAAKLNDFPYYKEFIIRNFYLTLILNFVEYAFFIKPSKLISFFVLSTILLTTIIGGVLNSENRYFLILESITTISCYFTYQSPEVVWGFKREAFISIKQTETLSQYYESLINNMKIQVVSLLNNKFIMYNNTFYNEVNSTYQTQTNDKKEINSLNLNNSKNINNQEKSNLRIKTDEQLLFCKNQNESVFNTYLTDLVKINEEKVSLLSIINCPIKLKEGKLAISNFIFLGTFTLKNNIKRFFDVYYRVFNIVEKKDIIDIYINEITDIKAAEQLCSETKIKHKLFSKFAHEFKTPIILIKSLLADILDKIINNEPLNEIRSLSDHANNLSDYIQFLINDIIYYSNEESISISIQEICLEDIVKFSFGVLKSLISIMPGSKSKIISKIKYDNNLNHFSINSDKTRLIQIMLNLISNAVKFTKSGEISIGAELIKDNINSSYYAQLYVRDTGIGIKEDDIANIRSSKDKIIKINIENSYNEMGTGIGLSIIKNLITKLGHKLEIYSNYGEGTDFNIVIENIIENDSWSENSSNVGTLYNYSKFPTLKTLVDIGESKKELQTPKRFKSSFNDNASYKELPLVIENQKLRILVCDDSYTLRRAVVNLVSQNKEISSIYDIIESYDGADMLVKVIEDQQNGNLIDIIITDENMEYMCGSTAISLLREWEVLRKIKNIFIVSLTAFIDEYTLSNIKQKGANMIITKPFSQKSLCELFDKFKNK